ncbi:MAG: hypothetical protein HC882_03655 [Acidobacteria bacterium]|nr:hypothetical protein [Acidobacteriota bacterium]
MSAISVATLSLAPLASADAVPGRATLSESVSVHRGVIRGTVRDLSTGDQASRRCEDLDRGDFKIDDRGGRLAEVVDVRYETDDWHVVVVADISEAMGEAFYTSLSDDIEQLRRSLAPGDELSVVAVSDEAWVLRSPALAESAEAITFPQRRQISHFCKFYQSRDRDGIRLGLELARSRATRASVIFVGDGDDNGSSFTRENLDAEFLGEPLVNLGLIRPDGICCPGRDLRGPVPLHGLALSTGGGVRSTSRVGEALVAMAQDLRRRVEITYAIEAPASSRLGEAVRLGEISISTRVPSCRFEADHRVWRNPSFQLASVVDPPNLSRALESLGIPSPGFGGMPIQRRVSYEGDARDHDIAEIDLLIDTANDWAIAVGPAIVVDDGLIPDIDDYVARGRVTEVRRRTAITDIRPAALYLPSVESIGERFHDVSELVLHLAETEAASGRDRPAWPSLSSPVLLESKTFFRWRRALVEAIIREREDWSRYVDSRRARTVLDLLQRLAPDAGEFDDAARASLLEALRARAERRVVSTPRATSEPISGTSRSGRSSQG